MSLNEICFFNNINTIKTSEVISVENSEYLQLDVTGTASIFKIIVYAQAVKEGQFLPLVVIGNGNFKIYDSIESNGFYRVSTRGVLNVKLVLVQIESGNLNCFGSLSLRRDVSDWNSSKETDLGYIKNRPFYTEEVEQDYYEVFIEKENIGKIWFTNEKIGLVEGTTYDVELVDINGSTLHSIALTATNENSSVMIYNSDPAFSIKDGIVDEELTSGDKAMINVVDLPDVRYVRIHGISSTQVLYHKIPKEYIDFTGLASLNEVERAQDEIERLQYYGDANVVPSDASLFTFTLDDATMTASIVLTDEAKNDTSVTDIVIPYKYTTDDKEFVVKTIGTNAFNECSSLLSIVIPNSVTSIALAAFRGCTSLSSIIIPEGVTRIMPYTFRDCTSLSNIVLPDSITNILNAAFNGCTSLSSIVIPKNVTSISSGAFSGCEILEKITIPSGVKTISSNAFQNCVCLSKITIPSSVTSISSSAFNNISDLIIVCASGSYAETYAKENGYKIEYTEEVTKAYVDDQFDDFEGIQYYNEVLTPSETSLFNFTINDETMTADLGVANPTGDIVIPYKYVTSGKTYKITSIEEYSFSGNGATSVVIPNTITHFGEGVFCNCSNLTRITIPNSVTSIGVDSFLNRNEDLTIVCTAGSYIDVYAKENEINVEYTDDVTKAYVDGKIGDDLNERLEDKVDRLVDTIYEGMFLKAVNGVATWSPVYIAEEVNF